MGGNNTKEKEDASEEGIKIGHERFERYRYIPENDNLEITIDVPQEKEAKQWQADVLSSVNGFENKESLLLPLRHVLQPKGWCGNTGSMKIYYDNFPYLFSEEIENRIAMAKHFQEEELWYLLFSLVGCAKDFSKLERKIGDVRPHNIFINEEGQIKIANIFSWPYEKTNFEKTAFEKQMTYISPEEMGLIEKGNFENKTNRLVSESFSIGLTLLQSGLLFNAEELYSVQNRAFDTKKLGNKINDWLGMEFTNSQGKLTAYSQLLRNMVAGLCQIDPDNRVVSLQIEDLLRPYQYEIMNLKPFQHKKVEFSLPDNFVQAVQHKLPPQEQVFYTSSSVAPPANQQVVTIPTQTYKVGGGIEPKPLVNYGPPQDIYRQQQVTINQGNYSTVPQNGYREVFTRYANPQQGQQIQQGQVQQIPQQVQHIQQGQQIVIPSGQPYQPNFHKYSALNQQFPIQINSQPQTKTQFTKQPQTISISQPFSTPQNNNTFNIPPVNVGTSDFTSNGQFFTASNFQQSQYVTTSPQYSNTQFTQFAPAPASNDFLKKIDQQLQNSRKLYPS